MMFHYFLLKWKQLLDSMECAYCIGIVKNLHRLLTVNGDSCSSERCCSGLRVTNQDLRAVLQTMQF